MASKRIKREPRQFDLATVRAKVAQVLWLLFAACALVLAVAALLISLGSTVDDDNRLVKFILDAADTLDLEVFSIRGGVFDWVGKNSDTKNALSNYGLGAIFWLVVGRIVDRVVRP